MSTTRRRRSQAAREILSALVLLVMVFALFALAASASGCRLSVQPVIRWYDCRQEVRDAAGNVSLTGCKIQPQEGDGSSPSNDQQGDDSGTLETGGGSSGPSFRARVVSIPTT